ncbi:MAG: dihydrofolate reductase [Bogoriella megaspora]|nr:MAG: dihydrofolate reductase [Bogoriella megaspora]
MTTASSSDSPTQPSNSTMFPASLPELTLIVAATPSMGIGRAGSLPWSPLKGDMAYFKRVTKRIIGPASTPTHSKKRNAVIMGRKTWESIPPQYRPLQDRINVVLTRGDGGSLENIDDKKHVVVADSLSGSSGALEKLQSLYGSKGALGRVFVIGGSSVYGEALKLPQARSVLLTKVKGEWECDTFFPLDLEGEEAKKEGWVRRETDELNEFVGENVEWKMVDNPTSVELEFCLFQRENGGENLRSGGDNSGG